MKANQRTQSQLSFDMISFVISLHILQIFLNSGVIFRTDGDPVRRSVFKRIKRSQVIIPLNFTAVNTIEFLIKFMFAIIFKSFVENCTKIVI